MQCYMDWKHLLLLFANGPNRWQNFQHHGFRQWDGTHSVDRCFKKSTATCVWRTSQLRRPSLNQARGLSPCHVYLRGGDCVTCQPQKLARTSWTTSWSKRVYSWWRIGWQRLDGFYLFVHAGSFVILLADWSRHYCRVLPVHRGHVLWSFVHTPMIVQDVSPIHRTSSAWLSFILDYDYRLMDTPDCDKSRLRLHWKLIYI